MTTLESITCEQHPRASRNRPSWWERLIGARSAYDGVVRYRWGEWSPGWGLTLRLGCYEQAHLHIVLIWGVLFIYLPFLTRVLSAGDCSIEQPSYGFSWSRGTGAAIHLNWGRRCKIIDMPWHPHTVAYEYLGTDEDWHPVRLSFQKQSNIEAWTENHPYHYVLDNGEVQHVWATVGVTRHDVRWTWFGRGPLSDLLRRLQPFGVRKIMSIDVKFSDEVGARRGSWKGGCVGCGYTMKADETPLQTLHRMQRERRFR